MSSMITNAQRKFRFDLAVFNEFVKTVLSTVEEADGAEIAIAFVSDARMKKLNRDFRGKNSTTDVLSFPHEPDEFIYTELFLPEDDPQDLSAAHHILSTEFMGDIAISVEQAARQAEEHGLSLELEIKQLILHGVLHLCGYDHETDNGEMNARELELRDKLLIS